MNIIKILAILALLYVGYRIFKMLGRGKTQEVKGYRVDSEPSRGEDLVQDPFCKTYVPKSQAYQREIEGQVQFFCSRECCEKHLAEKK